MAKRYAPVIDHETMQAMIDHWRLRHTEYHHAGDEENASRMLRLISQMETICATGVRDEVCRTIQLRRR